MKGSILTVLSMDSSHEELDLEMNNGNRQITLSNPPDINLPLSVGRAHHHRTWIITFWMLVLALMSRRRGDSMWGAWFFFSFYFRPALNEKSKSKVIRVTDNGGGGCFTGFDKSDLRLDVFLFQHDIENM